MRPKQAVAIDATPDVQRLLPDRESRHRTRSISLDRRAHGWPTICMFDVVSRVTPPVKIERYNVKHAVATLRRIMAMLPRR